MHGKVRIFCVGRSLHSVKHLCLVKSLFPVIICQELLKEPKNNNLKYHILQGTHTTTYLRVFYTLGDIKAGINQPFRRKNRAYLTYLGNGSVAPDLAFA